MKNPFESAETFNAWAQIPMWYDFLKNTYEEWKKLVVPIDMMIYKATGYDKKLNEDFRESAIICLEQIIEFKKVLEDDYSKDEKVLLELLQMA